MEHKAGQLRQGAPKDDFFSMLQSSLEEVNHKQHKASDLTRKMITNPEQVEVHDVMIALEHAKMSLNLARVVRDTTIKSYNKITNLR
jgi:flagellar hook-basal body complex protein FliE